MLSIKIGAAIVVVIVACRVGTPCLQERVVLHHGTNLIEPLGVCTKRTFLVVGQSIQAHILLLARAAGGGKGVGLRGLLGHLSPLCLHITRRTIYGHAALVELLAIAQHILAHLTQIDIQVAAVTGCGALLSGIDKGVEHPELDILDVRLLEVGDVQPAHHAAPFMCRVPQRTVGIEVGRQVIGAALLGIVGQVEHGQRRHGTVVGRLVAVGIEFLHIDLAHIVVRQLVEVVLDMARGERRRAVGKDGVYYIPCQQGTVVTAVHRGLVVISGKH